MQFTELWLRDWLNYKFDIHSFKKKAISYGLEVKKIVPIENNFHDIVVGKIVECRKYKYKNIFCINTVNIGEDKYLNNVICRSEGCINDIKVPIASLKNIYEKEIIIKYLENINFIPEGIICSFSDLGIKNSNKICILPYNTKLGNNVKDFLKLKYKDHIIEISVPLNRADFFYVSGIAREIAIHDSDVIFKGKINKIIESNINNELLVNIYPQNICYRYLTRVIKNINLNVNTPIWIKSRLNKCGITSKNLITDIQNYILLDIGQHVQVFDYDKVNGNINIRFSFSKEKFKLNNQVIDLNSRISVIADNNKIISIAGVYDNLNVESETKNIVLACALFNTSEIINNIKYCNFRNYYSDYYIRGFDINTQYEAIEKITQIISSTCGGDISKINCYQNNKEILFRKKEKISLNKDKIFKVIGFIIDDKIISKILLSIGFKILRYDSKNWEMIIPSWRFDILNESDIIEEILKIYGYQNIPKKNFVKHKINLTVCKENYIPINRIKNLLVDLGYQEVINYSFVNPKYQKILYPDINPLIIKNPISINMSVMRISLVLGLINTLSYNKKRQKEDLKFFETGVCFTKNENYKEINQNIMISGIITGLNSYKHWSQKQKIVDFYDIKGNVELILDLVGKSNDYEFKISNFNFLHPMQRIDVFIKNEKVGYFGIINPEIEAIFNLKYRTAIFEFYWNKINKNKIPEIKSISKFPYSRRDISIIVSDDIPYSNIINLCKKTNTNILVEANIFDVYKGKDIDKGFKSLSISFILQDPYKTLTEKDINNFVNKCILNLKNNFEISLRS